jgi:hypothetical protein
MQDASRMPGLRVLYSKNGCKIKTGNSTITKPKEKRKRRGNKHVEECSGND